jgi:hypothetical protein
VRDDPAFRSPALTVLAFLLAAAILIEWAPALGPLHDPDLSPNRPFWHGSLLLCGAAIALALRPSSTLRLLFLSACGTYNALSLMPGINNHNFFTLIADLSIVAAALWTWATTPGSGLPRRTFYRAVAPVLRAELLVLYFRAFFHKLNRDFFDPEVSCATVQLFQLSGSLPFVPTDDWARSLAMAGTLAVELAIPVLLVIPRARWFGVLLGTGFHSLLAFNYPGFSALGFAFYSLFLPESSYDRLSSERRKNALAGLLPSARGGRLFLEVCLFTATAAGLAAFYAQRLVLGFPKAGLAVAWGLALGLIVALGFAPQADARTGERRLLAMPALAFWLLPAVVFLSGLAPHLGVKNVHAFAMFSNLRTGGGDSNHLLLPSGLQVSNNLADVVRIRGSNDPVLDALKHPSRENAFVLLPSPDPWLKAAGRQEFQFDLPYLTLRTRVSELAALGAENVHVAYERAGETKRVKNAENDPELSEVSWLARKLMRLRAVPVSDRAPCMW